MDERSQILICDDDPDIRKVLYLLLRESYGVAEAADGAEAIMAVQARAYDLVLMDIQMPVMNGYEATEAIRALPREDASLLPIVALSANARVEDRERSKACGMNDHLAKPFDTEELIRTINSYVAAYHAQQASHHRAARS